MVMGAWWLVKVLPSELAPTEDRGVVYVMVKGAEGTSIERMKRNMAQVESRLVAELGKRVVKSVSFSTPAMGRGGDQTGMVIIQLTDWAQRDESAKAFLARLSPMAVSSSNWVLRTLTKENSAATKKPLRQTRSTARESIAAVNTIVS